ncbi:MAG: BtpA/SgcQ family protein [Candidatus Nezhaarchaeales archaeon]
MKIIEDIFKTTKAVIGVIHLPPLPGAPLYDGGEVDSIIEKTLRDARALRDGGIDGILIENFWDMPYRRGHAEPSTIACMAVIAREVAREVDVPLGINVLRNDAISAIAIAKAVGGAFIRANAYVEVIVTDQGIIDPCAYKVQRAKILYQALKVRVFADIHVKHGAPLVQRPVEVIAEEALSRGLADAIILTGPSTGTPPSLTYVERVRARLPSASIIIGSGCNPENISTLFRLADAAIVGSYFRGGNLSAPVDVDKVKAFMSIVKEKRRKVT